MILHSPAATAARRGAVAFVALITTACAAAAEPIAADPTPTLPACYHPGTAAELPAGFPGVVPLPQGILIEEVTSAQEDHYLLRGTAPGDLRGAVEFFQTELPRAGFAVSKGESDALDAESGFAGHGIAGQWRIQVDTECPGAFRLTLATEPH